MTNDPYLPDRYADLFDDHADPALFTVIEHLDGVYNAIQPPASLVRGPVSSKTQSHGMKGQRSMQTLPLQPIQPVLKPSHRGLHHIPARIGAIVIVLVLAILAYALFKQRSSVGGVFNTGSQMALYSISMVTPDEGWAVGGQLWSSENAPGDGTTLIYHYFHGAWTPQYVPLRDPQFPQGTFPVLRSVAMTNDHDGWAVGATTKNDVVAFFLHYDGKQWQRVIPPLTQEEKMAVAPGRTLGFDDGGMLQLLAANDFWAASNMSLPDGSETMFHYHNGLWDHPILTDPACWEGTPTPLPNQQKHFTCRVEGLDMLSDTEGWAVGTKGRHYTSTDQSGKVVQTDTTAGSIFHDVNGSWTIQFSLPYTNVESIVMLSPDEGWAIGDRYSPTDPNAGQHPLLLHYFAGHWQQADSPLTTLPQRESFVGAFTPVLATTNGSLWLTVSSYDTQARMAQGPNVMMLHYMGGHWVQVSPPAQISGDVAYYLSSIAPTSAGDAWAVGFAYANSTSAYSTTEIGFATTATPLILHYQNGAWEVVKS